ncbi:MAG: sigma-70 family RNA polymerase sigma factor [Mycobacteriales bacterium]|nr:sigma-70 family RNA polymerase sigma factor [Mycobacteriales bacterium]
MRDTATDLSLLRAALRDARREDAQRTARAVLVAGPGPHRGHVRFSVVSTSRVAAAGVGVSGTLVPGPSASTETAAPDLGTEPLAAPEGDTAVAIALVQRAQAGDAEAFGELYDRYVDLVYRYVYYRVSSAQLAEDLTSETFLRALRRISSFTWQGRDVGAWFVTIARNLIADHYKSGRYRLELTTDDVSESGAALVTEGPEMAVLEAMQNKVLLEAVKQLGPEQQECIVLRFLQGLSVAETAQAMGKNEGAIKALQYRAIRTLGRLLPEGVEL